MSGFDHKTQDDSQNNKLNDSKETEMPIDEDSKKDQPVLENISDEKLENDSKESKTETHTDEVSNEKNQGSKTLDLEKNIGQTSEVSSKTVEESKIPQNPIEDIEIDKDTEQRAIDEQEDSDQINVDSTTDKNKSSIIEKQELIETNLKSNNDNDIKTEEVVNEDTD
ncbi:MAG: hypothetical protein MHPSP_003519, partial [Paramarteilia canceri]